MLAAVAFAILPVRIKELVYGNVQQGDDLVKGVQARMLAPVLKIHDGTRGTIYELCKVFLRPAFRLSLALDSPITPILFYISGLTMRTKHSFMFW